MCLEDRWNGMTAVTRVLGTLFTQKDPAPCPGLVPSCVEFTSGTIIWYVLWEILRSAGRDQNGLCDKTTANVYPALAVPGPVLRELTPPRGRHCDYCTHLIKGKPDTAQDPTPGQPQGRT